MAKIDLYDPKWVDMVFADKNQAYGAYRLRKGTSGRNIKALLILIIAAALVGGFLAWKVIEQKNAEQQQAYMEAMRVKGGSYTRWSTGRARAVKEIIATFGEICCPADVAAWLMQHYGGAGGQKDFRQ